MKENRLSSLFVPPTKKAAEWSFSCKRFIPKSQENSKKIIKRLYFAGSFFQIIPLDKIIGNLPEMACRRDLIFRNAILIYEVSEFFGSHILGFLSKIVKRIERIKLGSCNQILK